MSAVFFVLLALLILIAVLLGLMWAAAYGGMARGRMDESDDGEGGTPRFGGTDPE